MIFKNLLHYGLHFVAPLLISYCFFNKRWQRVYLVFLLSMFIDLDHVLATPIFDKNRCSISFHPLHTYYAIGIYAFGLLFRKTRILAIALVLHMIADALDCYL
ncbi:DUF6122 family protein [Polaribacter sp. HL-MS24]|uniref:DUF6122 family protein n=1 Tax=Polaribacter sp. HL-MS24 TaxID=3077735 RepID=UPI002934859F|nr:DUF6122 family protein [Polaribacter sp. HL-MS24]WOC40622.1 DUF6122 family protein [Polaribacter sp. HL-MS24]